MASTGPPGIIFVNSKISKPNDISPENFKKWYTEEHIPDVLKSGGIKTAFRYEALDPSADRPYLAVYPTEDVNFVKSSEFAEIPFTSNIFPGPTHSSMDFVDFEVKLFEFVYRYEKEGTGIIGPARIVMTAEMVPAPGTDDDFNAWYRDEHCGIVAKFPGYIRTRRYKLLSILSGGSANGAYLAMHEFESDSLPPSEELAKTVETPWAQRVMSTSTGFNVGAYKLVGTFGKTEVKF